MSSTDTPISPYFYQEAGKSFNAKNFFLDLLQTLVIALAIAVVIYLTVASPNQVDGRSMQPNFQDKEIVFTNKLVNWLGPTEIGKKLDMDYKRGDVIVFSQPDEDLIKRIIAVAGDTIRIENNKVYVNGQQLEELYIPTSFRTILPDPHFATMKEGETIRIQEGKFFLMGDNREHSKDSRFADIGQVSKDQIKGVVFFRLYPFEHIGLIKRGEFKEISNTPAEE